MNLLLYTLVVYFINFLVSKVPTSLNYFWFLVNFFRFYLVIFGITAIFDNKIDTGLLCIATSLLIKIAYLNDHVYKKALVGIATTTVNIDNQTKDKENN